MPVARATQAMVSFAVVAFRWLSGLRSVRGDVVAVAVVVSLEVEDD
jgi:hypothetical protein